MCLEEVQRVVSHLNFVLLKLKGKVYGSCDQSCMMYGSERGEDLCRVEGKGGHRGNR